MQQQRVLTVNKGEILSHYNRKYGLDVYHFTLPISTCSEWATKACRQFCYSKYIWHNVRFRYDWNLEISMTLNFVENVIDEIKEKRVKWVRIHPTGDFYSLIYYSKWLDIATACRDTKFLAYTRNTEIDGRKAPKNLSLFFSMDATTERYNETIKRVAINFNPPADRTVYKPLEPILFGVFEARVCSNRCENCRFCWSGRQDVAFPILKTISKNYKPEGEQYHSPRILKRKKQHGK